MAERPICNRLTEVRFLSPASFKTENSVKIGTWTLPIIQSQNIGQNKAELQKRLGRSDT